LEQSVWVIINCNGEFFHTKTLVYFGDVGESNFSRVGASAIAKELGIGGASVYRALEQ